MHYVSVQENGCWLWTGPLDKGYGRFSIKGKLIRLPKAAWIVLRGPIAKGFEPDHLCRMRPCINPDHLEIVTHRINVQRGDAGKRFRERTHCPKGHAYDAENTQIKPNGARGCRTCGRESQTKKRRDAGIFPRKTHCPRGHEFTPSNTLTCVKKDRTQRLCATCEIMRRQNRSRISV